MVKMNLSSKIGENLIINPSFDIWQRGISFVSIANATYFADRYVYNKVGTMVHDVDRSTDIPTNVKGIYDKDPKQFEDAKLFKHITYHGLQELIIESTGDKQATAGEYRIFDAVSLQILKRSDIKVVVMSGNELYEFKKYWNGNDDINGTIISKK